MPWNWKDLAEKDRKPLDFYQKCKEEKLAKIAKSTQIYEEFKQREYAKAMGHTILPATTGSEAFGLFGDIGL